MNFSFKISAPVLALPGSFFLSPRSHARLGLLQGSQKGDGENDQRQNTPKDIGDKGLEPWAMAAVPAVPTNGPMWKLIIADPNLLVAVKFLKCRVKPLRSCERSDHPCCQVAFSA